jgi:hypothetical protein
MKIRKGLAGVAIAIMPLTGAGIALTFASGNSGANAQTIAPDVSGSGGPTSTPTTSDNCSVWQTKIDDLQAALDSGTTGRPLPFGGYAPGNPDFGFIDRIIDNAEIEFYKVLMSVAGCPGAVGT